MWSQRTAREYVCGDVVSGSRGGGGMAVAALMRQLACREAQTMRSREGPRAGEPCGDGESAGEPAGLEASTDPLS